MKDLMELVKNRRSTRKFTNEELTQDEVVSLLKSALMAPTSKNTRCWQFVVVDEKEILERLSHCKAHGSSFLSGAPLAVVVLGDSLLSDVWIEDASIASVLMQLQAEDMGLGSCWIQVRERVNAEGIPADEVVREILDIPLQMQVLSIIAVGHKAGEKEPFSEEDLQWEKIHINRYGQQ